MKTSIQMTLFAFALFSLHAQAAQFTFVAEDSSHQTRLCIAAASDDMKSLKREFRRLRQGTTLRHDSVISSVRCNGESAAKFAQRYGAAETLAYLNRFSDEKYPLQEPNVSLREIVDSEQPSSPSDAIVVRVNSK